MDLKIGRREQKKLTNRRAILDAGLHVEASGLSVGTLYNHFGDKDTIFAELIGSLVRDVRTVLSDSRSRAYDLESFIMGAFLSYSQLMESQPKMQQLISKNSNVFRQFVNTEAELIGLINDLEQDMQIAVESGLMPKLPVNLMTSAMMGASIEIFSEEIGSHSAKEKAEFLGHIFLGGIKRLASV
jgi:AcrR family transcriptional regulator